MCCGNWVKCADLKEGNDAALVTVPWPASPGPVTYVLHVHWVFLHLMRVMGILIWLEIPQFGGSFHARRAQREDVMLGNHVGTHVPLGRLVTFSSNVPRN